MTDIEKLERANHSMRFLVTDLQALCGAENPFIAEMVLFILPKIGEVSCILDRYLNIECARVKGKE